MSDDPIEKGRVIEAHVLEQVAIRVADMLWPRIEEHLNTRPLPAPRVSATTRFAGWLYLYRVEMVIGTLVAAFIVLLYFGGAGVTGTFRDIFVIAASNSDVLQFAGLVISALVAWVLKRLLDWLGIKLRADHQAMLTGAVDKAMTLAIVRTQKAIAENGWADKASHNEVVAKAIPILGDKFSETLRANGLDLSKETDRACVRDMMERMLPDVFSRASASPATPPAPVVPVAVVSPVSGA